MDVKSFALGYNAGASQKGGSVSQAELEAAIKKVVPEWALEETPPKDAVTSVNGKVGAVNLPIPSEAADVKADPVGTAETKTAALRDEVNGKLEDYEKSTAVNKKIGDHNVSTTSHEDLRLELKRLADRLNAALNSDDTSLDDLKEIVAYIKANKTLIDGVTASKVNVTDIVNNLTTNTANVPLSAAQGVALKLLIDSLEEIVEGKTTAEQVAAQIATALSDYPTTSDMGTAISNATKDLAPKSYVPTKVSQLSNDNGYLTTATGDQRYAKPSDIPTVPQTLPNPYALTILGKTYTGGKAVSLTAEEIMEAIKTASGGVVAYLDGNRLVLSGNLPDATYTAYYEVDGELVEIGDLTLGSITPDPVTYTITWVVDGKTTTETYEEGETPTFKGSTDKAADDEYTYTFAGWSPEIESVKADATYTAQYTQTAKPTEPAYDNLLTEAGYETGKKVSTSSGNLSDADACASGFIAVPNGTATIRIKNVTLSQSTNINNIVFYNAEKTKTSFWIGSAGSFNAQVTVTDGVYSFKTGDQGIKFFRFSCAVISDDTIVTINQEIK